MIELTDEYVKLGETTIAHNEFVWRSCTNRHTTTYGNSWGWIENAPGHVCWSNDPKEKLDRSQAQALVSAHNKWLEDIQPIQLKIIKAKKSVRDLTEMFKEKEKAYLMTKQLLEKAKTDLVALLED